MLERLKKEIPPYFVEKHEGVDEKQVKALPTHLRAALVHGTEDEAVQALDDLRTMERLRGKRLLGEAAMEMIGEMRHIANSVANI